MIIISISRKKQLQIHYAINLSPKPVIHTVRPSSSKSEHEVKDQNIQNHHIVPFCAYVLQSRLLIQQRQNFEAYVEIRIFKRMDLSRMIQYLYSTLRYDTYGTYGMIHTIQYVWYICYVRYVW